MQNDKLSDNHPQKLVAILAALKNGEPIPAESVELVSAAITGLIDNNKPRSFTFQRNGTAWFIGRDTIKAGKKGFEYIYYLLSMPRKQVHMAQVYYLGNIDFAQARQLLKNQNLRTSIQKSIRLAINSIPDPAISRHLATSIQTGEFISYSPHDIPIWNL